jgi:sugar (glycoside-pentoside-hexuronide) transporter
MGKSNQSRLGWGTRLSYGLGDFYGGASVTVISLLFLYFLTDVVRLPPIVAGGVMFAGRIADGLVDPALGILTDRTKSRWGRRAPWFLALALPVALVYGLLWSPSPFAAAGPAALWYGLVYVLSVMVFSGVMTPYAALAPELAADYDERSRLVATRMAFSIVSGLAAAVVPKLIVDAFAASGRADAGFSVMGWSAGAIFGLTWLYMFFFFKGKGLRPAITEQRAGIIASFRSAFSNRSFRLLIIIYLFSFLGVDLLSAAFVYYLNYWLRQPSLYTPVMAALLISAALSLPLHGLVSRRLGKRRGFIAGAVFWLFGLVSLAFLGQDSTPALVLALAALVGIGMGTAYAYPWAMLPETVDVEEAATGSRQEGLYAGVMTFLRQTSSSLAVLGLGAILQLSGYRPGESVQPAAAAEAIRVAVVAAPGLLLLFGIAAGLAFPISRAAYSLISLRLRPQADQGLSPDAQAELEAVLAACYGPRIKP